MSGIQELIYHPTIQDDLYWRPSPKRTIQMEYYLIAPYSINEELQIRQRRLMCKQQPDWFWEESYV